MKCKNCSTETQAGDIYQFYYGTLLEQKRYSGQTTTTVVNKYNIDGSLTGFLCNKCITTRSSKNDLNIVSILTPLGIVCIIYGFIPFFQSTDPSISNLIAIALGGLCLYGAVIKFMSWKKLSAFLQQNDESALETFVKSNPNFGDKMLMEIDNPELHNHKFTHLWSRAEYNELSKY